MFIIALAAAGYPFILAGLLASLTMSLSFDDI